jgi:hypothetical protein
MAMAGDGEVLQGSTSRLEIRHTFAPWMPTGIQPVDRPEEWCDDPTKDRIETVYQLDSHCWEPSQPPCSIVRSIQL